MGGGRHSAVPRHACRRGLAARAATRIGTRRVDPPCPWSESFGRGGKSARVISDWHPGCLGIGAAPTVPEACTRPVSPTSNAFSGWYLAWKTAELRQHPAVQINDRPLRSQSIGRLRFGSPACCGAIAQFTKYLGLSSPVHAVAAAQMSDRPKPIARTGITDRSAGAGRISTIKASLLGDAPQPHKTFAEFDVSKFTLAAKPATLRTADKPLIVNAPCAAGQNARVNTASRQGAAFGKLRLISMR